MTVRYCGETPKDAATLSIVIGAVYATVNDGYYLRYNFTESFVSGDSFPQIVVRYSALELMHHCVHVFRRCRISQTLATKSTTMDVNVSILHTH